MSDELSELESQIAELTRKRNELKAAKKAEVVAEVKKLVAQFDLTAADIGLQMEVEPTMFSPRKSTRAGKTVEVKYRRGENTWTGRGRKPSWLVEFEAAGGSLQDVKV